MLKQFVTGLQHAGLPTQDMKATKDFYHGIGFETMWENPEQTVCFLRLGGLIVETYPVDHAAGKAGAIDHLSLDCTDIEAAYAEVKKAGYTVTTDGIMSLPFFTNGVKYFNTLGPNGETIEFCQKL